jgi:hypothetical protein
LPEIEIAKRVLGKARAAEWPSIAAVLEEGGLPPVNPVFGMRYWPAVARWFDYYENVVPLGPTSRATAPTARRASAKSEKPCTPARKRQVAGENN